ncbi:MAG: tRNA dihydrouridine synthase DusB [Gammaproteobacteria bacterium]
MKIGSHQIDPPVILAPMAGVTDRPFRQLCKDQGAGLAVSEMVGANSLLHGSEKTKRRANHDGETRPVSVQIVGANPKMMGEAAKYNQNEGAEIIDINMGCPAKKVCNTLAGSALLKDEKLVGEILEAVVGAVEIPVTLKIRTGWDSQNKNAIRIGQIAENAGIQALTIHGRTRADRFQGHAEYDTIAAVKDALKIPIIANGDINTPEEAKHVLEYTKADAVMVGRAAQGRPWIFREIMHYLKTGELMPTPSASEVYTILKKHLFNLYDFYGEEKGVHIARKHVSWYSKGQRGSSAFRDHFNRLMSTYEQVQYIDEYFQHLMSQSNHVHT